ncbi:MAG TPA: hypothetical protein VIX84_21340 [Acidimicrobiales bacterium]
MQSAAADAKIARILAELDRLRSDLAASDDRGLPVPLDADPAGALRDYLADARTTSARALAAKVVVIIVPEDCAGTVVWPELPSSRPRLAMGPACAYFVVTDQLMHSF